MHLDCVYVFVDEILKLGGPVSHAHLNAALIALTEMLAGQADYCCCDVNNFQKNNGKIMPLIIIRV